MTDDTLQAALASEAYEALGEALCDVLGPNPDAAMWTAHILDHPSMRDWLATHDEQVRAAERERLLVEAMGLHERRAITDPIFNAMCRFLAEPEQDHD